MPPLCFAYYCSGHGYGHATRVSAFACHLLSLPAAERPTIYITSSAPKHVFTDSIALGALYRYAEIDPVIVQPLAYRVDRQKSVEILKLFLSRKDTILEAERRWLEEIKAHVVLSDAAFLGCLAAKVAGIPSVLITNFTFDSVYSYLATPLLQIDDDSTTPLTHLSATNHGKTPSPRSNFTSLVPDIPVPSGEIEPLVSQIFEGYRCADLLLLLPGCIPIPSFPIYPSLPAPDWINSHSKHFLQDITESLSRLPESSTLHPPIELALSSPVRHNSTRSVIAAPLLVRPPTEKPSVYTQDGRSRLLTAIGVPLELHNPATTKILVVSFGGQVFRAPSRNTSKSQSRSTTPVQTPTVLSSFTFKNIPEVGLPPSLQSRHRSDWHVSNTSTSSGMPIGSQIPPRLGTPGHIWIPGAPPASKHSHLTSTVTPVSNGVPKVSTIPPTPSGLQTSFELHVSPDVAHMSDDSGDEFDSYLLPDDSWIAIVCGASKEQWNEGDEGSTGLPDGFYVAPRDVYMPDLTAVGDVLLGKLGYGTVSECVDSCTPFVYVSRPLFIEEFGLRLLLDRDGVGVELSRRSYEAGDWALAVEEAWVRGQDAKGRKRADGLAGIGLEDKKREGVEMARKVVSWTEDWWSSSSGTYISN